MNNTQECAACGDSFTENNIYHTTCGHEYCESCTRYMVTSAIEGGQPFPPGCCGEPFQTSLRLATILGDDIAFEYGMKDVASSATSPIYCSSTNCGAFILGCQFGGFAICQVCRSLTCSKCGKVAHDGDCAHDKGADEMRILAEKEGWKACYKCGNFVDKAEGCDRITCVCGTRFCYKCSAPFEKCTCEDPNHVENRHLARDGTQGVHDQADVEVATPQVDNASLLWTHEQQTHPEEAEKQSKHPCRHHATHKRLKHVHTCPLCDDEGLMYILRCKYCRLEACFECLKSRRHDTRRPRGHTGFKG
ncbi:hypothetical protein F4677DRAFT_445495 [Hypoxylon crocopeplum]|nr:hypothetical protein F4677DRAFT_445495 [Hypoxylon crocopeplum]